MLELILVRHGETDSNKRGSFCGWTDAELNGKGIEQAEAAARKLSGIIPDVIYSSPLARTMKTAEIINRSYGLEINTDASLKERNCGKWEDLTYDEVCCKYPEERLAWEKDLLNYRMDRGESALQVYGRVNEFFNGLIRMHKDGKILAVTHLGCIQSALAGLLGLSAEGSWRFRVDNCGITRVIINDDRYAYLTGLNL